jgi:hypothetical protein
MVQETWLPKSAHPSVEGCTMGCKNVDAADVAGVEDTRKQVEAPWLQEMATYVDKVNKEVGRNITTIVPLWSGILSLRQSEFLIEHLSQLLRLTSQQWLSKVKFLGFSSNRNSFLMVLDIQRLHW